MYVINPGDAVNKVFDELLFPGASDDVVIGLINDFLFVDYTIKKEAAFFDSLSADIFNS